MLEFKQEKPEIPAQFQPTWPKGRLTELLSDARAGSPTTKLADEAPKTKAADTKLQDKPAVTAEARPEPASQEPQARKPTMPEPPAAKNPVELKPSPVQLKQTFAPTIAAGVLTGMQRATAAKSPDDITQYRQGDEFKLGKGGYALQKRLADERQEELDRQNNGNDADEVMEQYYAQQAFMQTVEFRAALETVNKTMRAQELQMGELRQQIDALDTRLGQQREELAGIEKEETAAVERHDGLVDLKDKRDEHAEDLKKEEEMYNRNDTLNQSANDMQQNTMKVVGKDVYLTVTENGQPVLYKIDESGNRQKVEAKDRPFFDPFQDNIYRKKTEDGKIQYVNGYGQPVPEEKKAQIDNALKASGLKPEEALADRDELIKARNEAEAKAEAEGVSTSDAYHQGKKVDESQKRLEVAAEKMKIPLDQLQNLETMIDAQGEELKEIRAKKEAIKADMSKTEQERALAQRQLEKIEQDYKQNQEFKTRLEKGEFENEGQMIKAMPAKLKGDYEENKELIAAQELERKNSASVKMATAPAATASDNTSRVNGSAAPPAVTASITLGPPFTAAATASPATPAAEPSTTAPEIVANQQKIQPVGARIG